MYKKSIFIFRRDLRLEDNTALNAALKKSSSVFLCFILDPRQVEDNEYKSNFAVDFMIESISKLASGIESSGHLHVLHGKAEDVISHLIDEIKAEAVFINRDYTPFSRQRDTRIENVCREHGVVLESYDDALLNPPEAVKKKEGGPYTVFTPFYKRSVQSGPRFPEGLFKGNILKENIGEPGLMQKYYMSTNKTVRGGRKAAQDILGDIGMYNDYENLHDYPAEEKTTRLSAYLKFGTVSVREVYFLMQKNLGARHPLIRQLYWRDFWTYIGYHFPYVFGKSFHKKYDSIRWSNSKKNFNAWCEGKTGFPIVDAGMRELNSTGFMHNRVRMIVASFLTKDLHIDWRWGEKYFARKLVDYDPCVNNGNWQWAASTGCDAQPFFRIFNPWRQQERFDKGCIYIKKWLPELRDVPADKIHDPARFPGDYPRPIVEHKKEADRAKAIYRKAN